MVLFRVLFRNARLCGWAPCTGLDKRSVPPAAGVTSGKSYSTVFDWGSATAAQAFGMR